VKKAMEETFGNPFYQQEPEGTTGFLPDDPAASSGGEDLYDYRLPPDRIRLYPPEKRGESRLLVTGRARGSDPLSLRMEDFGKFLRPGDLLVLNDTRVIPARVFARAPSGRKIELLFLNPQDPSPVRFLAKGIGSLAVVELPDGGRLTDIVYSEEEGCFLSLYEGETPLLAWLERCGEMPLPPYIRKARAHHPLDRERYQTVFSRLSGSVAAPTAGLHFTERLLDGLGEQGIRMATVTLHVGLGTFRPLGSGSLDQHVMHSECFSVPDLTAERIRTVRQSGGRIFAVGTTVVRTLESWALQGENCSGLCWTSLFIRPGFPFRVVDGLLTNFHQPRSTLLVLVDSFLGGGGRWKEIYRYALDEGFAFLSYGDAMLIVPGQTGEGR